MGPHKYVRTRFTFTCGLIIRIAYPTILDEQEIISAVDDALRSSEIPVIWNLRKGVKIPGAAERNLLPQGKFGIPHALLRPEELEAELLYHAGEDDAEIREYLFPAAVDPYRSAMRKRYGSRSRLLFTTRDELLIYRPEGYTELPLVRLHHPERKELHTRFREARRRAKRSENPAVLLIQPDSSEEASALCALLSELAPKFKADWLDLPELLKRAQPLPGSDESFPRACRHNPLPADPLNRFRRSIPWEQPSEGRLFLLARTHRGDSSGFEESSAPTRGLHAEMPGEVLMEEPGFSVRFDRGELREIHNRTGQNLLAGPTRPFMELDGEEIIPQRIGSFSFQDDPIRGMRDTLEFRSPRFAAPGRLVRDYFFLAGDPRLCISYFASYPLFRNGRAVNRYSLGELPLAPVEDEEEVSVRCGYPDGNGSELVLSEPGRYLLYGCRFSFATPRGELSLEFGEYQEVVHELPVEIRSLTRGKRKRGWGGSDEKRLLLINPGGSYTPCRTEAISGVKEQFSLILDLHGERPSTAPLLPYLEQYRVSLSPT